MNNHSDTQTSNTQGHNTNNVPNNQEHTESLSKHQ